MASAQSRRILWRFMSPSITVVVFFWFQRTNPMFTGLRIMRLTVLACQCAPRGAGMPARLKSSAMCVGVRRQSATSLYIVRRNLCSLLGRSVRRWSIMRFSQPNGACGARCSPRRERCSLPFVSRRLIQPSSTRPIIKLISTESLSYSLARSNILPGVTMSVRVQRKMFMMMPWSIMSPRLMRWMSCANTPSHSPQATSCNSSMVSGRSSSLSPLTNSR